MIRVPQLGLAVAVLCVISTAQAWAFDVPPSQLDPMSLTLRRQVATAPGSGRFHMVTERVDWAPEKTAIIICDMWDNHYCVNSARRVAEMAPRMNAVLSKAREMGVLIIHAPSGCMDFYQDTPQRKRAQNAPAYQPTIPFESWCHWDPKLEPPLPISDEHPCDDENPGPAVRKYTRQISTLAIHPDDAITDSVEALYLMRQRGIERVILMGVHANKCVLGRPFGIRQLVRQGFDVTLMRDLTDSMYSSREEPHVSHLTGNDLVISHIERHWCPTVTSDAILGGHPFRFAEDQRKELVIVMAEREYETDRTLPRFAMEHLQDLFRITCVYGEDTDNPRGNRHRIPNLEALEHADLAILSIRRRTLESEQLDQVRRYIARGKPLIALRTTSHAFCLRDAEPAEGREAWPEFDREVLGGFYQNHHGNERKTFVRIVAAARQHPVLRGLPAEEFRVFGSLYRSSPLTASATPLMTGRADELTPHEPVTWVNQGPGGSRVFYTSLGHPDDFKIPAFVRMLKNAAAWAIGPSDDDREAAQATGSTAASGNER